MFLKAFHTNRGSVAVDAAVSLPAFILSFVLIFSLITQAGQEDACFRRASAKANAEMACTGIFDTDITYLVAREKTKRYKTSINVYYRPFVGESKESEDENTTVYVYEKYGKRFHVFSCSTIENQKQYKIMTKKEALDEGYTPCLLCREGGTDYFKKEKRDHLKVPLL